MELYEFLKKGGILMIPIIAGSVIAVAVFLERVWSTRRGIVMPLDFMRGLLTLIKNRDWSGAKSSCASNGSQFATIATSALSHVGEPRPVIKESMEEAGQLEAAAMDRYLGIIGVVSTLSPLLGLLGTVTGMIKVFQDVAQKVNPQISVLARGIWEALITTGAGLTVAIISFLLLKYLQSRNARYALEMEESSLRVLDAIIEATGASKSVGAPPEASRKKAAEEAGGES